MALDVARRDGKQMTEQQPDTTALSETELIEIARWATAESINSYAAAMDSLIEDERE